MLRRTVLALLVTALPLSAFAAPPKMPAANATPEAIVARLYEIGTTSEILGSKTQRARYFTPATASLIEKTFAKSQKTDEPGIDYEPLIDGQDGEAVDLKISVAESSADKAMVKADFKNFDETMTVAFTFEKVKGVWKIADILGREDTSLVRIMTEFLK